jgi:hypothetical protein
MRLPFTLDLALAPQQSGRPDAGRSRKACRLLSLANEPFCHGGDRGFDGGRGSISERLYVTTSLLPPAVCHGRTNGRSRRVVAAGKLGVPLSMRPILVAQITAGDSLRALAREYGVSRETVRRVGREAASQL